MEVKHASEDLHATGVAVETSQEIVAGTEEVDDMADAEKVVETQKEREESRDAMEVKHASEDLHAIDAAVETTQETVAGTAAAESATDQNTATVLPLKHTDGDACADDEAALAKVVPHGFSFSSCADATRFCFLGTHGFSFQSLQSACCATCAVAKTNLSLTRAYPSLPEPVQPTSTPSLFGPPPAPPALLSLQQDDQLQGLFQAYMLLAVLLLLVGVVGIACSTFYAVRALTTWVSYAPAKLRANDDDNDDDDDDERDVPPRAETSPHATASLPAEDPPHMVAAGDDEMKREWPRASDWNRIIASKRNLTAPFTICRPFLPRPARSPLACLLHACHCCTPRLC